MTYDTLAAWAARWNVPPEALRELTECPERVVDLPGGPVRSEGSAQAAVRLQASREGSRLWRNNVGAVHGEDGSFVRFGLANESKQMNDAIKSADLIGIRPVTIEADHVGRTIGQFVSREVKRPGWTFKGTAREMAQLKWLTIVANLGGDAAFTTGGY